MEKKVKIGGYEYNLVGDDEALLNYTSKEVNEQLSILEKNVDDPGGNTLTVLAALNIAEGKYKLMQEVENERKFLADELLKMTEFLDKSLTEVSNT